MTLELPGGPEDSFRELWNDIAWLHRRWDAYKKLFRSQERVKLLNQTAPDFFHLIQKVLADDVLLAVARLLDPASTGNKPNLTLARLALEIEGLGEHALADEIDIAREQLRTRCSSILQTRNKSLAHRDYDTAVGSTVLDPVTGKAIDEAIRQPKTRS